MPFQRRAPCQKMRRHRIGQRPSQSKMIARIFRSNNSCSVMSSVEKNTQILPASSLTGETLLRYPKLGLVFAVPAEKMIIDFDPLHRDNPYVRHAIIARSFSCRHRLASAVGGSRSLWACKQHNLSTLVRDGANCVLGKDRLRCLAGHPPHRADPGRGQMQLSPATPLPDTVRIGSRITRIGRTSVTMEHAIWSESKQILVADGDSTVVSFQYDQQTPTPVPAEIRAAIEKARREIILSC